MNLQILTRHVPGKYSDVLREEGEAAIIVSVECPVAETVTCVLPFDVDHVKSTDMLFIIVDKIHDEVTESVNDYVDMVESEGGSIDAYHMIAHIMSMNKIRRGGDNLLYKFEEEVLKTIPVENDRNLQLYSEGIAMKGFELTKNEAYQQIL